jgi:hypothetical protein
MFKFSASFFFSLVFWNLSAQVSPDTVAPVLQCKVWVTTSGIGTYCVVHPLSATDFLESVTDDQTPAELLDFAVQLLCADTTGFPNQTLIAPTQSWLGAYPIEVFARDTANNVGKCTAYLLISDEHLCHEPYQGPYGTFVQFASHDSIRGVRGVQFSMVHFSPCTGDTLGVNTAIYEWPNYWGYYESFQPTNFGYSYTHLVPRKENTDPLNGVTTYDLVLISRHLLGLQPFTHPYQFLAADANMDGFVTSYDIALLRQLILGIIPELPHGQSWRFAPDQYLVPDLDPFPSLLPPDRLIVTLLGQSNMPDGAFLGIKIGDVNSSANPNE